MKKSIFYLSLSAVLTVSVACNRQQSSNNDIQESEEQPVQDAMVLHNRLMASFSNDWIERESDPELYPNYYGGSFIDNNGDFIIAVTENEERSREHLTNILGTDDFRTETVQYSYRKMMRVMDDIDNFLINREIPDDHPILVRFAGAHPDVMENRVKVILTEINENIIRIFKRDVTNSPLIIFEQGEIPQLY